MLYCLISSFGPQKKIESSTCTIKNLSDNENMPGSFLWQGNKLNRTSKIKCLLARHDIHLLRGSVNLHLCISGSVKITMSI